MNTRETVPSNTEAEKSLVSSLVIEPDMMLEVRKLVSEKDFHNEKYQAMFKVLSSLYDQQMPFDTFIFMDEVNKLGLANLIQHIDYVELSGAATGMYAVHYADYVKDASLRRRRWLMAQELVKKIYENQSTDEVEAWLKAEVLGVNRSEDGLMDWESSFLFEDEISAAYGTTQSMDELRRWTMPWVSWSQFVDPAEKGTIINVSAADGVGKTVTGEMLAEHWAQMGSHGVYVHFELNRKIMVERRLCRYSQIERRALITDQITPEQQKRKEKAKEFIRSWRGSIQYLHTPGWTMEQVVNSLRSLHKQGLCDFVIVDYLEKAAASPRQMKLFNSVYQREADDVEMLKSFSEDDTYGCRMVMLSQFGKEGKELSFDTLTRTKIRGAGEKTEKANVVVMLHKEICIGGKRNSETGKWEVEPGSYDNEIGIVIDKNTLGKTGRFRKQKTTPFFSIYDAPI